MVLSTLDLKTKFLRFVWEKIADTSQQLRKFAETVKKTWLVVSNILFSPRSLGFHDPI